ncbi:MAG: peptidase M48 Ste24p [Salinisphaeraceae bacterium]|nr:peptidase M48 Ste24p [Salinisphaeraceae bacterium]
MWKLNRKTADSLLALALLACALQSGCAVNPATGRPEVVLMSEQGEIDLGRKTHQEILKQLPVYNDQDLQAYVNEVGQKLAREGDRPELDYTFTVIDSPDVNAFALPGGYIYINRGLMAYMQTEAQLAAVLGHEIAHVTARHGVRQHRNSMLANVAAVAVAIGTGVGAAGDVAGIAGQAAISGYGRGMELEADRLGAAYMAKAGYDHEQMLEVLGILKDQQQYAAARAKAQGRQGGSYHGVFASHPENDQRLQEVVRAANSLTRGPDPVVGRDRFLRQVNGMVYGDSPEQGVSRGDSFYHGGLGFTFSHPPEWSLENQAQAVILIAPGGQAVIQLTALPQPQDKSPAQTLAAQNIRGLSRPVAREVNGLRAAQARLSGGGHVALVYHGTQAYALLGRPAESAADTDMTDAFNSVLGSFRQLTPADANKALAHRIALWQARPGWNYDRLARLSPLGGDAQAQLRLLNQDYPDEEPAAGETLKIVE